MGDFTRGLFGVRMLADAVSATLDQPRWNADALSLFATASIAFASMELHSLLMLLVGERTQEIGIRIALGATGGDVALPVLGGVVRLTAAGLLAGLALVGRHCGCSALRYSRSAHSIRLPSPQLWLCLRS